MEALPELKHHLAEISDLGRARALLAWDERTMMPRGGAFARAEQLATLTRVRHQRLAGDELGRLLDRARAAIDSAPFDSDEASLVRVATRDWERARRVPAELRAELARTSSIAERAWEQARARSDFAAFLPHLERTIELRWRYLDCFAPFDHPYDPLLDEFEPGMSTAELRPLLAALRDGLAPLLERVAANPGAVDSSCLHGAFARSAQDELARRVVAELPLEAEAWRLDATVHPFATAISERDIRLTTRYDEGYIGASLWSVIHEAGHGIYESGVPAELRRSPIGRPASLGFHESQSRLWENWVGRSRPYLSRLRPTLCELFPGFADVDAEALYRAANRVAPSLIRVEADELTYNLHIALRFELELAIFERRVEPRELPEAWNARARELLGLEVPDAAAGVLQDVHWAAGSFGYFPTYSLGNVIAAQLWEAAKAELDDLDGRIAAGELVELRDWLGERLYRHAGKFEPAELAERALGGPLDVAPLLRHLGAKVDELYA